MAILPSLKKLLIPRKNSNKVSDLDTNWRAIERWANALVTSSGAYASLTGPGETVTPGDLTQAGNLTVTQDLTVNGGQVTATNGEFVATGSHGPAVLSSSSLNGGGNAGDIFAVTTTAGVLEISVPTVGVAEVQIIGAHVNIDANNLSFFTSLGSGLQTITGSAGSIVALQNLLAALDRYGLIIDNSTP